jgi:hypothetical protein
MILFLLSLAFADTGDTGDTAAYVDTGAKAESVYVHEEPKGCGGVLGVWTVGLGAILRTRRSGRSLSAG